MYENANFVGKMVALSSGNTITGEFFNVMKNLGEAANALAKLLGLL